MTASISFCALRCTSGLPQSHMTAQSRVLEVVSEPAMKKSMMVDLRFSWPLLPRKLDSDSTPSSASLIFLFSRNYHTLLTYTAYTVNEQQIVLQVSVDVIPGLLVRVVPDVLVRLAGLLHQPEDVQEGGVNRGVPGSVGSQVLQPGEELDGPDLFRSRRQRSSLMAGPITAGGKQEISPG